VPVHQRQATVPHTSISLGVFYRAQFRDNSPENKAILEILDFKGLARDRNTKLYRGAGVFVAFLAMLWFTGGREIVQDVCKNKE